MLHRSSVFDQHSQQVGQMSRVTAIQAHRLEAIQRDRSELGFGKGHIPKQFGYLAFTVYTIYLVTSISLQYSKYGDS